VVLVSPRSVPLDRGARFRLSYAGIVSRLFAICSPLKYTGFKGKLRLQSDLRERDISIEADSTSQAAVLYFVADEVVATRDDASKN